MNCNMLWVKLSATIHEHGLWQSVLLSNLKEAPTLRLQGGSPGPRSSWRWPSLVSPLQPGSTTLLLVGRAGWSWGYKYSVKQDGDLNCPHHKGLLPLCLTGPGCVWFLVLCQCWDLSQSTPVTRPHLGVWTAGTGTNQPIKGRTIW